MGGAVGRWFDLHASCQDPDTGTPAAINARFFFNKPLSTVRMPDFNIQQRHYGCRPFHKTAELFAVGQYWRVF